jgi:hypothetical protein
MSKNSKLIKVVWEKKYDIAIKTQVEQHILVSSDITKKEAKNILMESYHEIEQRAGYKHHKTPTNIYVYLYDTEEKARAESGSWLAMLEYCLWLNKGKPVTRYRRGDKVSVQARTQGILDIMKGIKA